MKIKKAYNFRDVDMLTASHGIIATAKENLDDILKARPKWADPFLDNIEKRVDKAFFDILGLDPKKEQRAATKEVNRIMDEVDDDLATFKVQFEVDFSNNPERVKEVLKVLGFDQHFKRVKTGDLQSTVEMLYQFQQNMTPELKKEIIKEGMVAATIDKITGKADVLKNAHVTQETYKTSSPEISEAPRKELNEIYRQVSGIAKICADRYKKNSALKARFSFSGVISKMNGKKKEKEDGGNQAVK